MTDKEVLLLRRKLDLLLRTGKLLMESAADTNRIERNMKRVAAFMGIPEEKLHLDIRWTMIMVNVSDERNSFSKFQKCEKHGINMTAISQISDLSWRAIEEDYSLDEYENELEKIAAKPRNYIPYVVAIGAGFACGGFCKLFGCDWIAFLFASICAFIGFRVRARCVEAGLNVYMSIALGTIRYALSSVAGMCLVHRTGSAADQLCGRYARQPFAGRDHPCGEYGHDGRRHDFRYRVCHACTCDGGHHDRP